MRQSLILYTRPECELCEQAARLAAEAGCEVVYRDISRSLELLERYRDRIPVLAHPDSGSELGWPFDLDSVRDLAGAAT